MAGEVTYDTESAGCCPYNLSQEKESSNIPVVHLAIFTWE